MNETIQILMERDNISQTDALILIEETREALLNGDYEAIQDILGLEDDYLFDII